MNRSLQLLALVLTGIVVPVMAFGQAKGNDNKLALDARSKLSKDAKLPVPRDESSSNLPSLSAMETWSDVSVPAGQKLTLKATSDYTGAERVSVALYCESNLKDTLVVAYWSSPVANYFVGTSVIQGSSLLFTNAGGTVISVFGPQMQLEIRNTGTSPISCPQVTAYAVVH